VTVTVDSFPRVFGDTHVCCIRTGPLHLRESAIVRDAAEVPVKEPVCFRIQDELLGGIPWIAWDLWIQPRIKYNLLRSSYCSLNLHFNRLGCSCHLFFFFALLSLKYLSN
jgi:hypothetical protein